MELPLAIKQHYRACPYCWQKSARFPLCLQELQACVSPSFLSCLLQPCKPQHHLYIWFGISGLAPESKPSLHSANSWPSWQQWPCCSVHYFSLKSNQSECKTVRKDPLPFYMLIRWGKRRKFKRTCNGIVQFWYLMRKHFRSSHENCTTNRLLLCNKHLDPTSNFYPNFLS